MDFITCFPYDDTLTRFSITGSQLWDIFSHIMRIENRDGEGECYQVNSSIRAIYSDKEKCLKELSIAGELVDRAHFYTITLQGFHVNQSKDNLGISEDDLRKSGQAKVVSTSAQEILEEYLRNNQNILSQVEGRLKYIK
jgi:5'-nucleotidase